MQTNLKTKPVWIQLLLFIGMAFSLFIILSFIGAGILSAITGISMFQLQNLGKADPHDANMIFFIRGMLLIQFIGLWLVPTLLFAFLSDPHPMSYIGLKAPNKKIYWILGVMAMLIAIPFVEYTGVLNQQMNFGTAAQKWMKTMEEEAARQIQFMMIKHSPTELVLNLVFISLFAGIGEELFFRGILQRMLIRAFKSPWLGIIVTAFLFSAFHFQFYGFIPRFIMGIILGAVYWYSGSLWTSIIAHFAYDALIIVILYTNPSLAQNPDSTMFNPATIIFPAILSGIVTFLVIRHMKKLSTVSYREVYKNDKSYSDPFSF
jgi:hypothetical protein